MCQGHRIVFARSTTSFGRTFAAAEPSSHRASRHSGRMPKSNTSSETIAIFDNFCTANDPHGEHPTSGAFDFDGVEIFFRKSTTLTKIFNSTRLIPATPL